MKNTCNCKAPDNPNKECRTVVTHIPSIKVAPNPITLEMGLAVMNEKGELWLSDNMKAIKPLRLGNPFK